MEHVGEDRNRGLVPDENHRARGLGKRGEQFEDLQGAVVIDLGFDSDLDRFEAFLHRPGGLPSACGGRDEQKVEAADPPAQGAGELIGQTTAPGCQRTLEVGGSVVSRLGVADQDQSLPEILSRHEKQPYGTGPGWCDAGEDIRRLIERGGGLARAAVVCQHGMVTSHSSSLDSLGYAPPDGERTAIAPLRIGPIEAATPVELAPMAGVTNAPFRRLCRLAGESALPEALRPAHGGGPLGDGDRLLAPAGLYVTEMVTTRALVERNDKTLAMVRTDPDERVRSIQLYGVDPSITGRAVKILVEEDLADHIDLNFGCPAPKVTRKGGGAALAWKKDLLAAILRETVRACERAVRAAHRERAVPVTVKTRIGIDEDHETYLDVARAARNAGVAAIALHGRTARQHYSGRASWETIARLKEATDMPVLGNGDVWTGDDALRMMRTTGCDGVVVGRGCQGRPWLFADIVAALHGSATRAHPDVDAVMAVIEEHGRLLAAEMGEDRGVRDLRKHLSWYLKGYPVGGRARQRLMHVGTLADLHEALTSMRRRLPEEVPYPGEAVEGPRGRAGAPKRPHLPDGWLETPWLTREQKALLLDAESDLSGG